MAELKEDEKAWVDVLNRFRALQSSENIALDLKENAIPPLVKQVSDETSQLDQAQEEVEEVCLLQRCSANLLGQIEGAASQDRSSGSANP